MVLLFKHIGSSWKPWSGNTRRDHDASEKDQQEWRAQRRRYKNDFDPDDIYPQFATDWECLNFEKQQLS